MYDIVGIGTALIDFTPLAGRSGGRNAYEENPGGSIANFLVAAAKQGAKTAILAKVGRDTFGYDLKEAMNKAGVDTKGLVLDPEYHTSCSFVTLTPDGDRSFVFYNDNMADAHYRELDYSVLDETKLLDIASFALSGDESYRTIIKAIDYCREQGKLVSFDINWREHIWKGDIAKGRRRVEEVIAKADIIKASIEELEFITGYGEENLEKGVKTLMAFGPHLILVTYGEKGSSYHTPVSAGFEKAVETVCVDTTGAGDCCFASFISSLFSSREDILSATDEELHRALKIANKMASICVSRRGGIPSMPDREELAEVIL